MPGTIVNIRNLSTGEVRSVDEAAAQKIIALSPSTWARETPEQVASRTIASQKQADYSGPIDKLTTLAGKGLSALTLGGSDLALRATLPDEAIEEYRNQIEANPGYATAGEVGGTLVGALASGGSSVLAKTPVAASTRLGMAIAKTGDEAGLLTRGLRGAAGGAADAAITSAGTAVADAALSEDPLSLERLASDMGTRAWQGGAFGAAAGGAMGLFEGGLLAAGRKLKAAREAADARGATGVDVPADIATMDRAQVAAAKEAEIARLEAIRVPERARLVAELDEFREGTKAIRPWDAVATGTTKETVEAAKKEAARYAAKAAKVEARVAAMKAADGAGVALPTFDDVAEGAVGLTVPARALAGRVRALEAGVTEAGVKRAAKYIKEGQRDPVRLVARGDGALEVIDGRHRLLAAMEAGAPIKISVEQGVAEVVNDATVALGAKFAAKGANRTAALAKWEAKAAEARAAAGRTAELYQSALATQEATAPRWMREAGKTYIEADKHIDRLLRNREALAEATTQGESMRRSFRAALQEQRQALQEIADNADALRVVHATDQTGRRAAALEAIPDVVKQNRALQDRIEAIGRAHESDRLRALNAHDLMLTTPTPEPGWGQKMLAGVAFGAASSAVGAVPLVGDSLLGDVGGPLAGAWFAGLVGGRAKLGGAAAAAHRKAVERTERAVARILAGTRKARPVVPKLAAMASSAILRDVRFGPEQPAPPPVPGEPAKPGIQLAYEARARELAAAIRLTPEGPKVQPHVRQAIAEKLAPLALTAPIVADRLETAAAAALVYLYEKMPRPTQLGMTTLPPSDIEIRTWARHIRAVQDPGGIEERLADGTFTVEDGEVMRVLYPARMGEFMAQIAEGLGARRLNYSARLNLSILTGQPVEASMTPAILAGLQADFLEEEGTEQGEQAPKPSPAFGSVKRPEPTPAQRRAGGV